MKVEGDLDITGQYKVDGVPISAGGASSFFSCQATPVAPGTPTFYSATPIGSATAMCGTTTDGVNLWMVDGTANLYQVSTADVLLNTFAIAGVTALSAIVYDGTTLWAVDSADGKLFQISTAGVLLNTFTISGSAHLGSITIAGANLWMGDLVSTNLYEVSTAGALLHTYSALTTAPIRSLTFDGTNLWAVDNSSSLYVIATAGTLITTYTMATSGLFSLAYDGTCIWACDGTSIYVVVTNGTVSYVVDIRSAFGAASSVAVAMVLSGGLLCAFCIAAPSHPGTYLLSFILAGTAFVWVTETCPLESSCPAPMPKQTTVSNMYVMPSSETAAYSTTVFTLRKNMVDTPLTVTVAGGVSTPQSNTSDSVVFNAGDLIDIGVSVSSGAPAGVTFNISLQLA